MGPTKRNPRRFISLLSAVDSGVIAAMSSALLGGPPPAAGRVRPDQLGERLAARVHLAAPRVLDRRLDLAAVADDAGVAERRSIRLPERATASMSKPANAARKFSRFRRIVSHADPTGSLRARTARRGRGRLAPACPTPRRGTAHSRDRRPPPAARPAVRAFREHRGSPYTLAYRLVDATARRSGARWPPRHRPRRRHGRGGDHGERDRARDHRGVRADPGRLRLRLPGGAHVGLHHPDGPRLGASDRRGARGVPPRDGRERGNPRAVARARPWSAFWGCSWWPVLAAAAASPPIAAADRRGRRATGPQPRSRSLRCSG